MDKITRKEKAEKEDSEFETDTTEKIKFKKHKNLRKANSKEPEDNETQKGSINNLQGLMNGNGEHKPPDTQIKHRRFGGKGTTLSTILLILFTVASGAQIGTSHTKISIMQINSIEISRKTWISEKPVNELQQTLKTIKGSAIISERYVKEAHQIVTELGEPLRIEKNTITEEQEETLLNERNTIDPADIIPTGTIGYKKEEINSLKKVIADLSLEFWIKENNELSRILVSPKIDWTVTTNYEDSKGEWKQYMENGWTSFIPGGAIISKPVEIFEKTTRIGERSCITKANFSTESSMTTDIIRIEKTKETTLTEKCRIGNRQITSKELIKGDTKISLPLECSISSDILRCGRIKYLFENEEINQVRIRRVSIESVETKEKELKSGMSTEIIIAIVVIGILITALIIIGVKRFKTSTPNNSRPQSPNLSMIDGIEMKEMGPFKCLRSRNDTSGEREKYSIYNSYNSLDGSWRLDRNNGGNRSLNDTDVRKALVDSRFHQDEESAIACCYDPSFFKQETSEEDTLNSTKELTPKSSTIEAAPKPKPRAKRKAPPRPKEEEIKDTNQTSIDASWRLDRSDGTNRSLNQSEIEDKRPSAPDSIYPTIPLPFNPYFRMNPPPMPISTPPPRNRLGGIWIDDTPTTGDPRGDEEEEMSYVHQLEPIKFRELEGLLTLGEQKALEENKTKQ